MQSNALNDRRKPREASDGKKWNCLGCLWSSLRFLSCCGSSVLCCFIVGFACVFCCCFLLGLFPPSFGWSLVVSWSSSVLVPPSGYLVASCDGPVALLYYLACCGALFSLLHLASWQQRRLALCGVCVTLYTMAHV